MTATLQVLTCQSCGCQWERTAVRGRVPKRCPDCAPLATVKVPQTVEDDDPGVLVLCPACRSNNHRFCLRGELGFACECGCKS